MQPSNGQTGTIMAKVRATFGLRIVFSALILLLVAGAAAAREETAPVPLGQIYLPVAARAERLVVVPVGEGFEYVTEITHAGDQRLFVVEQAGLIKILHPDGHISVFLDIRQQVISGNAEYGMYGLAFHPGYGDPASAGYGFFYVTYTKGIDDGETRDVDLILSRFRVSADPDVADPESETLLLIEPQRNINHKGGSIDFDTRNHNLYLSIGDDSQYLIAQQSNSFKGKIIRLDIDRVPSDAGDDATRTVTTEIVAYGLRNPWRIDVDETTDRLFIGDVGSNAWEEVNLLALSGVDNFGWPCREGPIQLPQFQNDELCQGNFTTAIHYYKNDDNIGTCAVIGGRVYRPEHNPADGRYVFGDLCTRDLFTLAEVNDEWVPTHLGQHPYGLFTAISEGADGALYIGSFASSEPIYRLYLP